MRRGKKLDESMKDKFLDVLREQGNVTRAAAAVGISKTNVYKWQKHDPDFAARMEEALDEACDKLEEEAWRRAVGGVEKPVYQGGKLVGTVREYSDTLLIFLLKGNRPEKYRDRWQGEVTGASGGAMLVQFVKPEEQNEE